MLLYAPAIMVKLPVLPVFLWLGLGLLHVSNKPDTFTGFTEVRLLAVQQQRLVWTALCYPKRLVPSLWLYNTGLVL